MNELFHIARHLAHPGAKGGVLATLVTVQGSSYRRPGARFLLTPEQIRIGSVSGGCLEEDLLARAQEVATGGRPQLVLYDTTSENDLVWGIGLGCHGVVQVLLEKIVSRSDWASVLSENSRLRRNTDLAVVWRLPAETANSNPSVDEVPLALGTYLGETLPPLPSGTSVFRQTIEPPLPLVIFGAGDDAIPFTRLAAEIGWHITIADPRPAFATADRFPKADVILVAPAAELVARLAPGPDAVAVVMTHHYVHDLPIVRALLGRPLAYVGLLGPRKRAEKILSDLTAEGLEISPETRARLHAPVGLDVGAETPPEVALSIMTEIMAVTTGRDARPLRERRLPIHL